MFTVTFIALYLGIYDTYEKSKMIIFKLYLNISEVRYF